MNTRPALLSVLLATLFAGCSTAPPAPTVPLPATPAHFQASAAAQPASAPSTAALGAWWSVFADPALDALVQRAEAAHPELEAAAARLAQARAQWRGSEAERAPQLGLQAALNRQGGPLLNAAGSSGTLLALTASASYEADLFGRLAPARQAAELDVEASAAWQRAVRLVVQAEVAQTYFALRAADAEAAAAAAAVQSWQDSLRLTELRWQAGALPELAVHRLRAELATAQAEAAAAGCGSAGRPGSR